MKQRRRYLKRERRHRIWSFSVFRWLMNDTIQYNSEKYTFLTIAVSAKTKSRYRDWVRLKHPVQARRVTGQTHPGKPTFPTLMYAYSNVTTSFCFSLSISSLYLCCFAPSLLLLPKVRSFLRLLDLVIHSVETDFVGPCFSVLVVGTSDASDLRWFHSVELPPSHTPRRSINTRQTSCRH